MRQDEKISVIVPVYKVEQYIHRCIDSILAQTYANIEVIIVDDGSPDRSGAIADEFARTDSRVKVIHKENGGLSDARNCGMTHAAGEFTMFIDSDDWIDQQMIERMTAGALTYKADVVQSSFYYAYDDHLMVDERYMPLSAAPTLLTGKNLMRALITNEQVKNFAWGKLYKTQLIRDISFEKDVLFEDVFWAHQVMHRAEKFLLMSDPFYYYYQRNDSIVANYTSRNLDMIKGLRERHRFIEKFYESLTDVSFKGLLKMCLAHYHLLFRNRKADCLGAHKNAIHRFIKENRTAMIRAAQNDNELRVQLYLFLIHPYLNISYLALRKLLRKLRIIPKPAGLTRIDKGGVV
ncbi:Glycosyltransferase involved in cell wall bisynthesis [Lentibacillus persicus]|uniref:Glycosyltransferase involved in cell wall bisynthesis n=1 Tax=Lentibacillus persicus TaxID=640948 RepID=A0A1I1U8Z5_9BACI|nr:glycosyltransferase [Lentibacillus persicus]SFD67105.1 Glycosyltransferase involved in cell wall bisynthesis [Lentibacillus persicus]